MKKNAAIFILSSVLSFAAATNEKPVAFTGSIGFQMPEGTVQTENLDSLPSIIAKSEVVYPEELVGSGIVGKIRGFAILRPDGGVMMLVVLSGNDLRYREAVRVTTKQWSFSTPMKGGHPVGAYVEFEVIVSEQGNLGPYVIDPKLKPDLGPYVIDPQKLKPNQSSEPTAPSGRGSP